MSECAILEIFEEAFTSLTEIIAQRKVQFVAKQKEWVFIWIYIWIKIETSNILLDWSTWCECVCACIHTFHSTGMVVIVPLLGSVLSFCDMGPKDGT